MHLSFATAQCRLGSEFSRYPCPCVAIAATLPTDGQDAQDPLAQVRLKPSALQRLAPRSASTGTKSKPALIVGFTLMIDFTCLRRSMLCRL